MRWLIDGNNVMGARADGWWNDPPAAARRLVADIAEWCRTHDDEVTVIFDRPVDRETRMQAGGNLTVLAATRRGRDAADDDLVDLAVTAVSESADPPTAAGEDSIGRPAVTVVSSDRGLRERLPSLVERMGAGRFLAVLDAAVSGTSA